MLIKNLENYDDTNGNCIKYDGDKIPCEIEFRDNIAHNNTLIVNKEARIAYLKIQFLCNNAMINIAKCENGKFIMQVGEDCLISIGNNVICTRPVVISAAEGTSVSIGNDVMFASGINIKTHDHHPIFNVETEKRLNTSQDITIEDHVWISDQVYISKASIIKSGSMIGFRSFVAGYIPNNCIAVGSPAKVIKKNIAWERTLLNWDSPYYKPNASYVEKSIYWAYTLDTKTPEMQDIKPIGIISKIILKYQGKKKYLKYMKSRQRYFLESKNFISKNILSKIFH